MIIVSLVPVVKLVVVAAVKVAVVEFFFFFLAKTGSFISQNTGQIYGTLITI